jgi:hypothetical protein
MLVVVAGVDPVVDPGLTMIVVVDPVEGPELLEPPQPASVAAATAADNPSTCPRRLMLAA